MELPVLTKRIGRGRNAVSVSGRADGSGLRIVYGVWSHAKRRVLNAEEEVTYRKCHFREENPSATYAVRRDYAARIRPIAGSLTTDGDATELVGRLAALYDALVVVGAGVPDAEAAALATAPPLQGRVFRV